MRRPLFQFCRESGGVALIEFALVFPVFFVLLFGGIEISRLILIQQKLEKAGYVLADLVADTLPATTAGANGEISAAEMTDNIFPVLGRIINPYGAPGRHVAIVTSVQSTGGALTINWQMAGGGTLSGCDTAPTPTCVRSIVNGLAPGDIGPAVAGQAATFTPAENGLLAGYAPLSGTGSIIVSEVFYAYQPILQQLLQEVGNAGGEGFAGFDFFLPPRYYVKRTYFLPRKGDLPSLPPDFPVL